MPLTTRKSVLASLVALVSFNAVMPLAGGSQTPAGERGLVAWWKLDEVAGTTIADTSGNGNAGAIEGNHVWSSGKVGGALQLDGRRDTIIRVPSSASLKRTSRQITVMAWTYRTGSRNAAVISLNYPDLFLGFHGRQFKWQIRNSGEEYTECNDGNAVENEWFHLAGTYDGTTLRMFVNGTEICQKPRTGPIPESDAPFLLSGYLNVVGSPNFDKYERAGIVDEVNGKIDDVRVYDRALTAAEIGAIHRAAPASTPAN